MLNSLFVGLGRKKKVKVLGRGIGCGKGKTSGRGHKGQKSRSGVSIKGFEGGQQSILTRLPKRGFTPLYRKKYTVINLSRIEKLIADNKICIDNPIDKKMLFELGLISSSTSKVKIIGSCNIEKNIVLDCDFMSKASSNYITKLN